MTPLAEAVLEAATSALAHHGAAPVTEGVLSKCREDARAVAVLVAIGGAKGRRGLLPFNNGISQTLLTMADELEADGVQTNENPAG